ncbi:hypothetical protein [Arthrobacter crusticola]|nr:hypothetical protein [Arthrobacter crusticola]
MTLKEFGIVKGMTLSSPSPIAEFAFPGPLRDKLVAAILSGVKTLDARD